MRLSARAPGGPPSESGRRLVADILARRTGISTAAALADAAGNLLGPLACLPYSPEVGNTVQQVGAALRDRSTLTATVREAVVLAVACADRSAFEWYAHERIATLSGALDADDVVRVAIGATPGHATAALATRLTRSLLDVGMLDDDEFVEGVLAFGEGGMVELVILVGYYRLLALLEKTFRTPLAADTPAPPWESSSGSAAPMSTDGVDGLQMNNNVPEVRNVHE